MIGPRRRAAPSDGRELAAFDDVSVVSVVGDLDVERVDAQGDLLCSVLDLSPEPVVLVDCTGVGLLGTHGVEMMRRVDSHAVARGVTVIWAGLAPLHHLVLEITGVHRHLHLRGPGRRITGPDEASRLPAPRRDQPGRIRRQLTGDVSPRRRRRPP